MKNKTPLVGIFISFAWCLAACLALFARPDLCSTLNFKMYDWKLALAPLPEVTGEVVHVDVDAAAVRKYGQWPWDREMSAKIVNRLSELGAKAVVFDIFYTSAGRSQEGDEAFFAAIEKAGNVVSATALSLTDDYSKQLLQDEGSKRGDDLYDRAWEVQVPDDFELWKVSSVKDSLVPLSPIILLSRAIGHIKGTADKDGVHRRIPLLVKLEDRCIPSLSLAALLVYWNIPPKDVRLSKSGEIVIPRNGGHVRIPVDYRGNMLVHWAHIWDGPRHRFVRRDSVMDILSAEPGPPKASPYRDKIVIVDVTHTGSTDLGVTPRSTETPLSRIHSHALNTMLTQSFVREIPCFPWVIGVAVLVTILFSVVTTGQRWKVGAIEAAIICGVVLGLAMVAFVVASYEIPVAEFFLVFAPAALVSQGIRGVAIERQAAKVSRTMERYLDHEVLEQALQSGTELDITVKRTELTILFVDMQGFSTISETAGVEYVHRFLDDFFLRMTRTIFDHHGTVDKFLGDGLLAFFGDPVPLPNHAESAVRAAIEMQREMAKLNAEWSLSGISEFKQGVRLRIGINTGIVIVGDLGSGRRVEYTVVGSAVNIASRLQSLAPPGGILMTARTQAMVRNLIPCDGPVVVRVKGIDRDIEVYRIFPEGTDAP
jgi:adenylate cyclase